MEIAAVARGCRECRGCYTSCLVNIGANMRVTKRAIVNSCMFLIVLSLISCGTPNEPSTIRSGKFYADSLALRITSEMHPDYQEMRGRVYLYLEYHFEDRPGRIERWIIAPNGVQPISGFSMINKCKFGPIPIDTIAGGSLDWWFWNDISSFDSLTVYIELSGNYWDIVNIGDSCKVITYGPFEWSTNMMVEVEN
jgi:hypothetical protein